MTTTCNHALYAIVDVFTQFYEIIPESLTDDLYCQLKWCINQGRRSLLELNENYLIHIL
jgi:brefeldin A-inhibited guanine nucleotide-exchange protein